MEHMCFLTFSNWLWITRGNTTLLANCWGILFYNWTHWTPNWITRFYHPTRPSRYLNIFQNLICKCTILSCMLTTSINYPTKQNNSWNNWNKMGFVSMSNHSLSASWHGKMTLGKQWLSWSNCVQYQPYTHNNVHFGCHESHWSH